MQKDDSDHSSGKKHCSHLPDMFAAKGSKHSGKIPASKKGFRVYSFRFRAWCLGPATPVLIGFLRHMGLLSLAPWLATNEGMDPDSSTYVTDYSSLHVHFHFFIPS